MFLLDNTKKALNIKIDLSVTKIEYWFQVIGKIQNLSPFIFCLQFW